ncbi:hypothetical protein ABPG77_010459 [Micractinium sp. CCAP 211/92]
MAAVLSSQVACVATRRANPIAFKADTSSVRATAPLRQRSLAVVRPAAARPSLPLCRSGEGEQQPSAEQKQQQPEQQQKQPAEAAPKRVDPSVAKGQRTAIITGAISIIFGVIYLGLVSFLDMRGGELLPPPPEAYLP